MKSRIILLTCVFTLAISMFFTTGIYAYEYDYDAYTGEAIKDDISYKNTPINKLGRGTINTATCWAEVPARVFKVSNKYDPLTGLTLGTVEGVFSGIFRGLTGIFDAVTFLIPPYNKPVMQPEYALARLDGEIEDYLW